MVEIIYKALDDKQAVDIKVLDIRDVTVMADYFIIAHGNNPNHVKALIDNTEEQLDKEGFVPKHVEGYNSASWILLDYNDVIIHIFSKDDRMFYDLERIWSDGKQISFAPSKDGSQ
ncbi:MAG: ribosome silencing factor [Firmicutes bacterium HGW-Firmicutes-1]|nr:MAG: ribosome silencing factor [Firmicutes bacterium HGW-Firmicutes-1]